MQGVPLDGYWLCFDEAHLMNKEAVAVLMESMIAIFNAIKSTQDSVQLFGSDVSFVQ